MYRVISLFVFVFLLSFISGCGGGGGSSSSSVNPTALYSGKKVAAHIDQSNYADLVRVLFGNSQISNVFVSQRSNSGETYKEKADNSSFKINSILEKTISRHDQLTPHIKHRTVSETVYCEQGTANVTGSLDNTTVTGRLSAVYSNCTIQGVTMNGTATMDIHKFNVNYNHPEHYTLSYEEMHVLENNQAYTSTAVSTVTYDFGAGKITSIDNILIKRLDKDVLFENFTTTVDNSGNISISGKIYHEDYGYVVVSTENPVSYSYSGSYYPETGGPILLEGANQTLRLLTQGQDDILQVEYINDSGQIEQATMGDLSPFTISLIAGNNDGSITNVREVQLRLSEPLDLTEISLLDLQVKDASGNIIPTQVSYDSEQNIITLAPQLPLNYSSQYYLELNGSWNSVYDKPLQFNGPFAFATSEDHYAPKIISITPAEGSSELSVDTTFVVEFDETINADLILSTDNFLTIATSSYSTTRIPTIASVSGSKLTITPVDSLDYGQEYKLTLRNAYNSEFEDIHGNRSYSNYDEWLFGTIEYGVKIDLGVGIDYFELDKSTNKLYTLDKTNKSLVVINLNTDQVESTHQLIQIPSQFCLDTDSDRIYFTTTSSSFIEEYRLSDFQKIASMPWSAGSAGYDNAHFHIRCSANELFVANAEWSPQLYSIERASPHSESLLSGIESVGGFHLAQTGEIYTWFQYGWNAGLAGSKIQRFQESQNVWTLIDESTKGYPEHDRDPLDSPILVDENAGLVINKRYIFNSLNLQQVIYDFGEDQVIYAADFNNKRAATLNDVYSLENYNKLMSIPIYGADGVIFDNEGDLYILKNDRSALYMISESEL